MGKARKKQRKANGVAQGDSQALANGKLWVEQLGALARTRSDFPLRGRGGCKMCGGAGTLIFVWRGIEEKISSMGYPVRFPSKTDNFHVIRTPNRSPRGPRISAMPCNKCASGTSVLISEAPPSMFVEAVSSDG